jgi:di/tricarboxylate transporter
MRRQLPSPSTSSLLVYGSGRYEFGDFVKVGTPLTILAGLVVAVLMPLIWRT